MTVQSDKPLDYSSQIWRGIDDKFPKKIHNATSTSDGLMSAEDKAKLDAVDLKDFNRVYDVATWENDGLMSKEDKKKMDGIEENANNYIHPNNPQIRHVTDEQIEFWNSKTTTKIATFKDDGLMSSEDKTLLYSLKAAKVKNMKYRISKKDIANFGKVTIPIDNLNDDSTVIVGLDYSLASQDQYEAASLARFKPAPISGGIEIYCNGVKPNIDIPASIIIMGVD